ncbi:MAG: cytochrome P450 [Candidatus Methylumidiphilus sp.]
MLKPDFRSAEFIADPYPHYARLRAAAPVCALAPHTWLLTRYRDADLVLRDARLGKDFKAVLARRYGRDMGGEPAFRTVNAFLLLMNPPQHTRLRGLLSKAFSVKQAAELRAAVQAQADALVDGFIGQGQADLVSAYAYPLTVRVICGMLGLELERGMLGLELEHSLVFQRETSALLKTFELVPLTPDELDTANAAALRFEAFFREVLAQRRRHPGGDLVSLLLATEESGDRLSEDEIIANIVMLFVAGHETTANMLGNALALLSHHPQQLQRLREDPSLLPGAVEECLRFDAAVQIAARVALQAVELGGVAIAAGDTLYLALGAANRDPDVFDDADRFRIDRPAGTAKALSFGGGIHYCLGARLARIELETGLATLLRRLPSLRIDDPDSLKWKPTFTVRGPESLPAQWQ